MRMKNPILFAFLSFVLVCSNSYGWFENMKLQPPKNEQNEDSGLPLESDPMFQAKIDKLFTSVQNWNELTHREKIKAVDIIITLFKQRENSAILNTSEFYVGKIDESFGQDPTMMSMPLPLLVKIFAVMEYDFYNGQEKEKLAMETLGQQMYDDNKKRREQKGLQ